MNENIESKAWDWSLIPDNSWTRVSDEFLPVAFRWKELGKRTVLDLGCGRGRNAVFLAGMGFEVTAVDLSPDGIEQLEKLAGQKKLESKIKTLVCDMLELPFSPGSFDCVLAFHSIYHTDYAGLKSVIANITDFLKDSGQVYLTFNSKSSRTFLNPDNPKVDGFTVIKTQDMEKGIPHTYLDYDDIRTLLSDFEILKIQHIKDFYPRGDSYHYFVEAMKK